MALYEITKKFSESGYSISKIEIISEMPKSYKINRNGNRHYRAILKKSELLTLVGEYEKVVYFLGGDEAKAATILAEHHEMKLAKAKNDVSENERILAMLNTISNGDSHATKFDD